MGNTTSNTGTSNGKQRISRRASTETGKAALTVAGSSSNAGGMSRSASGTDINEKNYTQFVPVDKLAKVNWLFCIFFTDYFCEQLKEFRE